MSVEFNWAALQEPPLLESLRELINGKLATAFKGDGFVQNLTLKEISFGAHPPEVVLEDLRDPHPEFLLGNASPFGLAEEEAAQLVVRVKYEGPLVAVVHGELAVNYPAPQFVTLPFRIAIKEVLLHGKRPPSEKPLLDLWIGRLYVVRLADKLMISLRRDAETKVSFAFDSEIGDPARHSLKNVGRVEAFVQSLIFRIIEALLVFPNYLQLHL